MFIKSVFTSSLLALSALAQSSSIASSFSTAQRSSTISAQTNSTVTGGIAPVATSTLTTTVINGVTVTAPASPLQTVVVNGITVNIQIISGVTFVNGVAQVPVNPNAGQNPIVIQTIYRTVTGTTTVFKNACACPAGTPGLGGPGSGPGGNGLPGVGVIVPGSGAGGAPGAGAPGSGPGAGGIAPGSGPGAGAGPGAGGIAPGINPALPGNGVIPAGAQNVIIIAPGVYSFTITIIVVIPASVVTTAVGGITRTITVDVPRTVTSTVTSTTTAPVATNGGGIAPLPGAGSTTAAGGAGAQTTATVVLPTGPGVTGVPGVPGVPGVTGLPGVSGAPASMNSPSATTAPTSTVVILSTGGTPLVCVGGVIQRAPVGTGVPGSPITIDSTGLLTCGGQTAFLREQLPAQTTPVYDVVLAPSLPVGAVAGFFQLQGNALVAQLTSFSRKRQMGFLQCGLDVLGRLISGAAVTPVQLEVTPVDQSATTSQAEVVPIATTAPVEVPVATTVAAVDTTAAAAPATTDPILSVDPIGATTAVAAPVTTDPVFSVDPIGATTAAAPAATEPVLSVDPIGATTAVAAPATTEPVFSIDPIGSNTAVGPVTTAAVVEPMITTAPVIETTTAPVVEATTAPVVEATTAPVVEATTAPVVEATTAPVVDTTTAPVVDATTAPAAEATTTAAATTTTTRAPFTLDPACATTSPRPFNIFGRDAGGFEYDLYIVRENGRTQTQNADGTSLDDYFRFNPCGGGIATVNDTSLGYRPADSLTATGSVLGNNQWWREDEQLDNVYTITRTGDSSFSFDGNVGVFFDVGNNLYSVFDKSVTVPSNFRAVDLSFRDPVNDPRACVACPPPVAN